MKLSYRFEPEAEQELQDAAVWYETEREGLGEAFLDRAHEALELARQFPSAGGPVAGTRSAAGLRQVQVRKFPYRVLYMVAAGCLVVVAVAHHRRRPGYWKDRL